MPVPPVITPAPGVLQNDDAAVVVVPRQVVLTQTITYADRTTTAFVTLGPGPGPGDNNSPIAAINNGGGGGGGSSSGPSSAEIGIIVGIVLGVLVVAFFLGLSCVARRRMGPGRRKHETRTRRAEKAARRQSRSQQQQQQQAEGYWPTFPTSIPPPVVPTYNVTVPPTTYTANGVGRTKTTTTTTMPYSYYETRGRR